MMKRKRIWIIAFFFFGLLPANVFAQTLRDELSKQINENYGSRFSLVDILSMERVTNKASEPPVYVIEISIQGKKKLRLPAKVSRHEHPSPSTELPRENFWKVDWLAKKEYVVALENLSKSGRLPELEAPSWDAISRLPAFPVLLTAKRILTPFGVLEAPTKGERISPMSLHASRWINEILEGDQALAAFEIITPAQTNWASIHHIMLTLAGTHGLFQMYLVGVEKKGASLTSMLLRTTVGATMPTRIISLARDDDFNGIRVTIKNEKGIEEVSRGCPKELPDGKFCSASEDPVPKIMLGLFSEPLGKNERVILGFSKGVMVEDVFEIVSKLCKKLKITSDRFLVTLVVE